MVGPEEIPKDDLFHVLQNPRRRAIMRYLLDSPSQDQFTMSELTEEIAAWENGVGVRQLSSDQRKRLYISLYQIHLPTLDEYGVVEFDEDRSVVTPTRLLSVFEPYLSDGLHDADDHLAVPAEAGETERSGLARTVTSLLSK